ncbi:hypothetical protein [Maribacter sp.]|uniref:hypothetical protein n=1 Tax=Maribacter sp. TaxID=1897614 RepID=UPI0025BCE8DD|nr:hypothetical protein [Maribacter sp.]
MEPNKIEKHMQKVFKERKISPSDSVWESISQELDVDKKPNNKGFYWYAIAASILIVVSFSLFFYTTKDIDSTNEIVIEQIDKEIKEENQATNKIIIENNSPALVVVPSENLEGITKEDAKTKTIVYPIKKKEKETIAHNEPLLDKIDSFVISDSVLDSKVASIVEKTEFFKTVDYEVTDAEIDSLLREAQLEILTNKLFLNNNKVDALALLNEVEGELDTSFREQIFKSLKDRFLKVKTAVADRNN